MKRINPGDLDTAVMAHPVEAGKLQQRCLREISAENARKAHAVQPITSVRSEPARWTRDPEDRVQSANSARD